MIEVDGGWGEGGGQILRSSLALSAITGQETKIVNIRVRRPNPGLRPQHLMALKAVSKITSGEFSGGSVGSTEIRFKPGYVKGGEYEFDIGTAGSITLLLQTIVPVLMFADRESRLRVRGGTDVEWSPSMDYFRYLFLELLGRNGLRARCEIERRGYYPKGGGSVRAQVQPIQGQRALDFRSRGEQKRIWGRIHSNLRGEVTDRLVRSVKGEVEVERSDAISPGIGITLFADYGKTILGSCALGERGVRAKEVGRRCWEELKMEIDSKATLDLYAMDQMIPYMGLFGGAGRARELSLHASTNIHVAEIFLGCGFKVEESSGGVFVFRASSG
jgi:RNA 3'-phosphate cyclase